MGWIGQFGNIPKHLMQYALSLLSIPSHGTMGWIGQNGDVPKCPMQYALFHGKARDGNGNGKKKKKGSTAVA